MRLDFRGVLSAALLLVQLVLGGALPFADARVDGRAGESDTHVEAGTSSCPATHDHVQCQFCRHLATTLFDAVSPERSPAAPEAAVTGTACDERILALSLTRIPGARAPPVTL